MAIFSAIVLFAMIWFITLLIVVVIRQPSQADTGTVVKGTHAGAPAEPQMRKRFLITTGVTIALWAPLVWFIASGQLTIDDIDLFTRLGGGQ